jgi:hypothetical protein
MAYQLVQSKQEYIGLSADTKPEAASPGSTYHAVDTGEEWVYYNGVWSVDLRKVNLSTLDTK